MKNLLYMLAILIAGVIVINSCKHLPPETTIVSTPVSGPGNGVCFRAGRFTREWLELRGAGRVSAPCPGRVRCSSSRSLWRASNAASLPDGPRDRPRSELLPARSPDRPRRDALRERSVRRGRRLRPTASSAAGRLRCAPATVWRAPSAGRLRRSSSA